MIASKYTAFSAAVAALLLNTAAWAEEAKTDDTLADSVVGLPVKTEPLHRTANMSYKVAGKRYYPTKKVVGFNQTGKASWYGPGFHGRKTASGERFNMNALTAAHRTLPIPSYAKVTNLSNGKSVVVRINDRGPFHGSRVLDVSKAAAQKLGFLAAGTANVKVEQIVPGGKAKKNAEPMQLAAAKNI